MEKGYGLADMEGEIPCDPSCKFRLGSVTKQFTSLVIMHLVVDGSVALDNTVHSYLPYYRIDTGSKVTIHHLLCHQSGIPNLTSDPEYVEFSKLPYTTEKIITERCSNDLEFVPGSEYRYSNSNYVILWGIIESVTGMSYTQVIQERIFTPLHMRDSGYDHYGMIIEKRVRGYQPGAGGYRNARYIDMSVPHGAGALYSTVRDLYRWDRALYGDELLPEKYRQLMFTPNKGNYGYGWAIHTIGIGSNGDSVRSVVIQAA